MLRACVLVKTRPLLCAWDMPSTLSQAIYNFTFTSTSCFCRASRSEVWGEHLGPSEHVHSPEYAHSPPYTCMWPFRFPRICQSFQSPLWTFHLQLSFKTFLSTCCLPQLLLLPQGAIMFNSCLWLFLINISLEKGCLHTGQTLSQVK